MVKRGRSMAEKVVIKVIVCLCFCGSGTTDGWHLNSVWSAMSPATSECSWLIVSLIWLCWMSEEKIVLAKGKLLKVVPVMWKKRLIQGNSAVQGFSLSFHWCWIYLQIKGFFCSENIVLYIFTLEPNTEGQRLANSGTGYRLGVFVYMFMYYLPVWVSMHCRTQHVGSPADWGNELNWLVPVTDWICSMTHQVSPRFNLSLISSLSGSPIFFWSAAMSGRTDTLQFHHDPSFLLLLLV